MLAPLPNQHSRERPVWAAAPAAVAFLVVILAGAATWAAEKSPGVQNWWPYDTFGERVEPLETEGSQTQAERDRLRSAVLFMQARLLEQRGRGGEALHLYQRAYRYAGKRKAILEQIVPLAARLRRYDEAARYAVLAPESLNVDGRILRGLANYRATQRDRKQALRLYELTLRQAEGAAPDALGVLLRMEMGRLYFLEKDFEKASEVLEVVAKALRSPNEFGINAAAAKLLGEQADRLYPVMGEAFFQAGRYEQALAAYKLAHAKKPNAGLLAFQQARILEKEGKLKEARRQLIAYFDSKVSVAGAEPYELLQKLLARQAGDEKQGAKRTIKQLRRLRKKDPQNAPLAFALARLLEKQGDLSEAADAYEAVLKLKPATDAQQGLVRVLHKLDQPERLIPVLAAVAAKSGSLDPLGDDLKQLAQDEKFLTRLARAADDSLGKKSAPPGAALAMGLVALEAKNFDLARDYLERALRAKSAEPADIYSTWALALLMAEENERAAAVLKKALAQTKDDARKAAFELYLSHALAGQKKFDEALQAAERCAKLRPDVARFQSRPAQVLHYAKRYDEAAARYLKVLEKFGQEYRSPATRQVVREVQLALSNLEVLKENMPAAEEWLEKVLDEFPDDIGALNDLGYLWADQGKHLERALEMTRRAVEGEPDNKAYRDSYGWALYRLGRHQEAVEQLEKAAADKEPDGVILDHLGDAYHKLGQHEKARQMWRRAVEAFKKQDDSRMLIKTKKKLAESAP